MKIRLKIIAILLVLNGILCFPSIMAYFVRQETVSNEMVIPEVTCLIDEEFNGQKKTSITVQNTGDIKAYIRVKIIHHWVDSKGDVVGRKSTLNNFTLGTGWLKIGDAYYYTEPVDPTDSTLELLGAGQNIQLKTDSVVQGEVTFEYNQAVEIHAEAIQAEPTSTIKTVWGVNVDANGKITN